MKLSDNLSIDSVEYASQGNAILGIRGSGKSYTATAIAEKLMDDNIPFIAFDPIGIWRSLKIGKNGPGYPVVVAGDDGDLPLTPAGAVDIVRAAMKENVSLVVDLYSMSLTKADWRRIVEDCVRLLLYENKPCGLRHVFIEEAAEFCPQRVGPSDGKVYAEIEKLARMGGNASLGYTLINQRPEEVNKAVLELCDTLFLHRQKGRHSLTALSKWLDVASTKNADKVMSSLPSLEPGQCWVWSSGSHTPEFLQIPEKRTVHPDRKNPLTASTGVSSDVSKFVDVMTTWLVALKTKNGTDQLPVGKKAIRAIDQTDLNAHYLSENKKILDVLSARELEVENLKADNKKMREILWNIQSLANLDFMAAEKNEYDAEKYVETVNDEFKKTQPAATAPRPTDGKLPSGELKILTACAQYPKGLNRSQLSTITSFAKSTRDRYIQYLREKQLVEVLDGKVLPTKEGRKLLGKDFKPLPTGKALQEFWLNTLPEGEARILALLIRQYPRSVAREDISKNTEYAKSTRDRYIQYMVAKEIVKTQNGKVVASENLFN